jgi:hypothetical protein
MDNETLLATCQVNKYALCHHNPILRKRVHDYKQFLIKVNNIINNKMRATLIIKTPIYHKIVDILSEMGVYLADTSNITGQYDNPQIYQIHIVYNIKYIDISYIDHGNKYIDAFEVTPEQLETFLITNYNNDTIDIM